MLTGLATCSAGLGNTSGTAVATFAAAIQFFVTSQCLITERWPEQAEIHDGASYDFVVVGGGTAGATLAARLSEVDTFSVLLIEAGGNPPEDSIIPGFRDALKFGAHNWNFTTVSDNRSSQELQNGSQRQPSGKMLGGSHSIGDLVYSRGTPSDYGEWASIVGPDWDWNSVLKYFKKTEHMTDESIVDDPKLMELHGVDGEIEVSGSMELTPTTKTFMEAFKEMGYSTVKDMTSPHAIGAGRFSHTVRQGRRDSVVTALLNRAAKRPNLSVLKDSLVTKIIVENNRAIGVKMINNKIGMNIYASKEVIVTAGNYNTPKLLMLSGIGPREHLVKLGINVVQDLPVGENLHDHAMVLMHFTAEPGTCPGLITTSYLDMMRYLYDHSGTLSKTDNMGIHIADEKSPNDPKFSVMPTCIPVGYYGFDYYTACMNIIGYKSHVCRQIADANKDHELLTLAIVLLKPKSRGRVELNSTNPLDDPLIYSGTFSEAEDLDGFPELMSQLAKIVDTKHFNKKNAQLIVPALSSCAEVAAGPEELRCRARGLVVSAWHGAGTAALGSVLDAQLAVRGVHGLRVADASSMPVPLRAHPAAPVVMIAEKASTYIKAAYGFES